MNDIERETFCNEIDFLQEEVERYKEQNKKLVNFIIKLKDNDKRTD